MKIILMLEKNDKTYAEFESAIEEDLKGKIELRRYKLAREMINAIYERSVQALLMTLEDQYIDLPPSEVMTTKESRLAGLEIDAKKHRHVRKMIPLFTRNQFNTPVIVHDCADGKMFFSHPMPNMKMFHDETPIWIKTVWLPYVKWLLG